jgi:hypothetical protein
MRTWIRTALLAGVSVASVFGQDVVYRKSRILGERKRVDLVFSGQEHALLIRKKGTVVKRIPFGELDGFSFRDVKRRRMSEAGDILLLNGSAGVLAIFTLPVTLVVAVPMMFTKETKHQLEIDFQDGGVSRSMTLDKSEYRTVLETIRSETGKRLEMFPANKNP